MKMTNAQYAEYAKNKSPKSPIWRDMVGAFLAGGIICCIGQGITDGAEALGLAADTASAASAMTLVFLGALLTGLGIYDDIAKFAGAGTLVPITGFANSVVSPALEFKTEGYVTGTAAKMFVIAGPVIVFGLSASVIYGLLLVLFGVGA
jgi:stage V sporulation protein AC